MSTRILVTGDRQVISDRNLKQLTDAGYEVDYVAKREPSDDELNEKLSGIVGYLFGGFEYLDATKLSRCGPSLKCVALLGEDPSAFLDTAEAKRLGIAVVNTPGATTTAVSEFAVAQLLNGRLQLPHQILRGQPNSTGISDIPPVLELGETPIGIVGLGRIGTRVASILRTGFGATVKYWNRTRKLSAESDLGIEFSDLDQLFVECRSIVICVAAQPDTRNLVSAKLLGLTSRDTVLVCVSKNSVLDTGALLERVANGHMSYAALDWVVPTSLSVDEASALAKIQTARPQQLVITRHIANNTAGAWRRMGDIATDGLIQQLRAAQPRSE